MSLQMGHQLPLSIRAGRKTDMRTQFSALCFRIVRDKPKVLLVTSRGSKRWILPKGWPEPALTPAECAAKEAWEEAGVKGRVYDLCLGVYSYEKQYDKASTLPCVALVYPIKVKSVAAIYPETGQRQRKWVGMKRAASMVSEPELSEILRKFDPRILRG